MDDREFAEYARALFAGLPPRRYEPGAVALAIGYPWERPSGSYRLGPDGAVPLERMSPTARDAAIAEFTASGHRLPLLAIGSNGAPEVLERKFAHFDEEEDRAVLVLSGRLQGFDVGFAARPALYGSLPATIFSSPDTAVGAALLWVTAAQFTQLAWSELSYRLGRLEARFEVDEGGAAFEEVLVFVSRFGALCLGGEPVAMAAIHAAGRRARALSQEQALDAVAALALGERATAETLVRSLFEDLEETIPKLAAIAGLETRHLRSTLWTPLP
jgi:hypothetical protein